MTFACKYYFSELMHGAAILFGRVIDMGRSSCLRLLAMAFNYNDTTVSLVGRILNILIFWVTANCFGLYKSGKLENMFLQKRAH